MTVRADLQPYPARKHVLIAPLSSLLGSLQLDATGKYPLPQPGLIKDREY